MAVAAAGGVEVWTHVERVEEMILFVGEQEVQLLLLEQDEKDCMVLQLSRGRCVEDCAGESFAVARNVVRARVKVRSGANLMMMMMMLLVMMMVMVMVMVLIMMMLMVMMMTITMMMMMNVVCSGVHVRSSAKLPFARNIICTFNSTAITVIITSLLH